MTDHTGSTNTVRKDMLCFGVLLFDGSYTFSQCFLKRNVTSERWIKPPTLQSLRPLLHELFWSDQCYFMDRLSRWLGKASEAEISCLVRFLRSLKKCIIWSKQEYWTWLCCFRVERWTWKEKAETVSVMTGLKHPLNPLKNEHKNKNEKEYKL